MYFFSTSGLAPFVANFFPCARAESFMAAGGYGRGDSLLHGSQERGGGLGHDILVVQYFLQLKHSIADGNSLRLSKF